MTDPLSRAASPRFPVDPEAHTATTPTCCGAKGATAASASNQLGPPTPGAGTLDELSPAVAQLLSKYQPASAGTLLRGETHAAAAPALESNEPGLSLAAPRGNTAVSSANVASESEYSVGLAPEPSAQELKHQAHVDAVYARSGLHWGRPPIYSAKLPEFGVTTEHGVLIGELALKNDAVLISTLIHENTHVTQLRSGNYAHWNSAAAGYVAEAEAYRTELLRANVEKSGISAGEQEFIVGEYKKVLLSLQNEGAKGEWYYRQILLRGDFTLLPEDRRTGPVPEWAK